MSCINLWVSSVHYNSFAHFPYPNLTVIWIRSRSCLLADFWLIGSTRLLLIKLIERNGRRQDSSFYSYQFWMENSCSVCARKITSIHVLWKITLGLFFLVPLPLRFFFLFFFFFFYTITLRHEHHRHYRHSFYSSLCSCFCRFYCVVVVNIIIISIISIIIIIIIIIVLLLLSSSSSLLSLLLLLSLSSY